MANLREEFKAYQKAYCRLGDSIRKKFNIIDFIKKYTTLSEKGKSLIGICPFCKNEVQSFVVNEDKQVCYCFECKKGGNLVSFLKDINNFSSTHQTLEYIVMEGENGRPQEETVL